MVNHFTIHGIGAANPLFAAQSSGTLDNIIMGIYTSRVIGITVIINITIGIIIDFCADFTVDIHRICDHI